MIKIWLGFLFDKVFNYRFNFINNYWTVNIFYFFWIDFNKLCFLKICLFFKFWHKVVNNTSSLFLNNIFKEVSTGPKCCPSAMNGSPSLSSFPTKALLGKRPRKSSQNLASKNIVSKCWTTLIVYFYLRQLIIFFYIHV